jgi:hypothetical protein
MPLSEVVMEGSTITMGMAMIALIVGMAMGW